MKLGILGYGRLGGALALLGGARRDVEEIFVFSDREQNASGREVDGVRIYPSRLLYEEKMPFDVLLLAHGSYAQSTDETELLLSRYSTVDCIDTHSILPERKRILNAIAIRENKVAVVGVGWDPGILSVARTLFSAILPTGTPKTAWGEGVSEGHSHALRTVCGVQDAVQYTVPTETGHRRVCYVVADEGEEERIEREIIGMPQYFLPYDTEVHFISREQFDREHKGACDHRGRVYHTAPTCEGTMHTAALSLEVRMQSNPEFTASVMLAYANACLRLEREGRFGAYGPLDIPMSYLLLSENESLW